MHDIFARIVKASEPLYIFTVLAILFGASMRTIVNGDFKPEVDTVLTTAIGGLLGLMGTVVAAVVNANKSRDTTGATRATDQTAPTPPTDSTKATPIPATA